MDTLQLLREYNQKALNNMPERQTRGEWATPLTLAAASDTWSGSRLVPIVQNEMPVQQDPLENLRKLAQVEQYALQNELAKERIGLERDKLAMLKAKSGAGKPLTPQQIIAANAAREIVQAEGMLPSSADIARQGAPGIVSKFLKYDDAQQFDQAEKIGAEAYIRAMMPGKTPDEKLIKEVRSRLYPQKFDTKETIMEKKRLRQQALNTAAQLGNMQAAPMLPTKLEQKEGRKDVGKTLLQKFQSLRGN